MPLKSAWELALEKSGGGEKPLSDAQKAAIAAIRGEFAVKRKELRFTQEREREAALVQLERMDDREGFEKMTAAHARALASLDEDEETKVAAARAARA